jgi:glycosyltransferase involved in cell wall biosynthesis
MRIAHINTNVEWGGGEYQVLHLLKGMRERRVEAVLCATPKSILARRADEEGLSVVALPHPLSCRGMGEALIRLAPDLVHLHDSTALSVGGRAARRLGVPAVYSRRIMSRVRRNPFSRIKYSPRRLAAVIAISDAVRDVFLRTGFPPGRVHVVPSGLDLEALETAALDTSFRRSFNRPFLVGGIGKLSAKKNWRFLVQVAHQMSQAEQDIQWVIAGDGPEQQKLLDLSALLGVSDRVLLAGFVPEPTGMLKTFDALFFPSILEGASVTVRQAMALGIPVVAVDNPGVSESLAGHGWLVQDGDIAGAAAAVREVLGDDAAVRAKVDAARKHAAAAYGIGRTVDETLSVYRRVLESGGGNTGRVGAGEAQSF